MVVAGRTINYPGLAWRALVKLTAPYLRFRQRRLCERIAPMTSWIERAPPQPTSISVVLPTRNRSGLLPRAIASVLAQEHEHWELLVVDDGSSDDTPAILRTFDDPRIQVLRTTGLGLGAARNVGLDNATGDVVAYVDDDNLLHSLWLKAVAWAFAAYADVDVVYGVRVAESDLALPGMRRRDEPQYQFLPFNRERMKYVNTVDIGTVAHRRTLDGARFDPQFPGVEDWDLLIRLSRRTKPLALPVVAVFYSTAAPDRLSIGDAQRNATAALSDLSRRRRFS